MALISKPKTFAASAVIVASEHNSNFDTIYNEFNGSISNANITAAAAIADTKLAQITTASKVNMTALVETSEAQGDILYRDGTDWSRKAIGSIASVLAVDTGDTTPYWASLAAIMPYGSIVQATMTAISGFIDCTTALPFDDTIPQITEGGPILISSITPKETTNSLKIDVNVFCAGSGGNAVTVALFQDATAGALKAVGQKPASTDAPVVIGFTHWMATGSKTRTQFRVNVGQDTSGTVTVNGVSGGRIFGGVASTSMDITEIRK